MTDNGIKFGLGIMCWEDTTWLYPIVKELRDICDVIVVGWQEYSYCGEKLDKDIYDKVYSDLYNLHHKGLIDNTIIIPNIVSNPEKYNTYHTLSNETSKRNSLHQYISSQNVDYVLIIDSDEFHFKEDIIESLKFLKTHDVKTSYIRPKNFVLNTYIEFENPNQYVMNYFCSSQIELPFKLETIANINIDVTRSFDSSYNALVFDDIYKYHFAWIRPNIEEKINNYSQPTLTKDCDDNFLKQFTEENLLKNGKYVQAGLEFKCKPCNYPELNKKLIKHFLTK